MWTGFLAGLLVEPVELVACHQAPRWSKVLPPHPPSVQVPTSSERDRDRVFQPLIRKRGAELSKRMLGGFHPRGVFRLVELSECGLQRLSDGAGYFLVRCDYHRITRHEEPSRLQCRLAGAAADGFADRFGGRRFRGWFSSGGFLQCFNPLSRWQRSQFPDCPVRDAIERWQCRRMCGGFLRGFVVEWHAQRLDNRPAFHQLPDSSLGQVKLGFTERTE